MSLPHGTAVRASLLAALSVLAACRPNPSPSRRQASVEDFHWAPDEARYEARVEPDDDVVLQTIPEDGLLMLGRVDGEPPRFVGYDPDAALFYLLADDGTVLRTRRIQSECHGCMAEGGVRGSIVFLGVYADDLNERFRWDLATDDVETADPDDNGNDPSQGALCLSHAAHDPSEFEPCAPEAMPRRAPRIGGRYLPLLDAFARNGRVYVTTPEGLVELHDGRADWTRCRARAYWRVADRFGVRVIGGNDVCDAERGVLARGRILAVSANGRFVLLTQGDPFGDVPLRYFLFDAARGARALPTLDLPTFNASPIGDDEPVGYRPFLDDAGRFLAFVPSGMGRDQDAIFTVELRDGRVTRVPIPQGWVDDGMQCRSDPLLRGTDVFSGGCGQPAHRVSLATGTVTSVSERPMGAFEWPPRTVADEATRVLAIDGLDLRLGASALRLVALEWRGTRIGVVERRGDRVVVSESIELRRRSRRLGTTTPLRTR